MLRPASTLSLRWRLIPALILVALWLPGMNQGGFRGETNLFAAVGLHAWSEGSLFPLMAGEMPYLSNPPLAIWIHGLFLKQLGTELWVARLPTLLASIVCVFVFMGAVRSLSGPRVALASGMVLSLTMDYFRSTRAISLDVWMVMWLMAAVWCMAAAARREGIRRILVLMVVSGVAVGLSLMTKPVIGLLVYPIAAVWFLLIGRSGLIVWLLVSVMAACAVAWPWHAAMYREFGETFVREYLESVIPWRGVDGAETSGWWRHAELIGRTYWPWLICAAGSLVMRQNERTKRALVLAVVWNAVWLIVLSVTAAKSARHTLVLDPMLAWMSGLWLVHGAPRLIVVVRRALMRWVVPVGLAGSALMVGFGLRVHAPESEAWRELSLWAKSHAKLDVWTTPEMVKASAYMYLHTGRWLRVAPEEGPDAAAKGPPAYTMMIFRDGPRLQSREADLEYLWRSGKFYAVQTTGPWDGRYSTREAERTLR